MLTLLQRTVHATKLGGADPAAVSEEEALRGDLPEGLRCDACLAAAAEISRALDRWDRHLTRRQLTQSEIIDVIGAANGNAEKK